MMPYSNPLPPRSASASEKTAEPPTIQKPVAEPSRVAIIRAPKPRETKSKHTTLELDQELTDQVRAFAEAQGLANLNEGIRVLLRAAMSSDTVLSAMGSGWRRGYWEGRVAFFEAASRFIEEHRKVIVALQQEASLYTQGNSIHIPGEQPPTW